MKDLCLTKDSITLTDEADLIIQQIDMLLDTDYGEVLGTYTYGSDLRQYLWDMRASATEISDYVTGVIRANVHLFGWTMTVDTSLLQGTQNDIIIIKITLNKNNNTIEKTYKVK